MAKAKTPRIPKPKATKNVLQMPDNTKAGNGFSPIDLESEIRVRAYELYEQRGSTPGNEAEDWLTAEREVLSRHTPQTHTA